MSYWEEQNVQDTIKAYFNNFKIAGELLSAICTNNETEGGYSINRRHIFKDIMNVNTVIDKIVQCVNDSNLIVIKSYIFKLYNEVKPGLTFNEKQRKLSLYNDFVSDTRLTSTLQLFCSEANELFLPTVGSVSDLILVRLESGYGSIIDLFEEKQLINTVVEKTKEIEAYQKEKTINEEKLREYFISSFKGMGQNLNYFNSMIRDLKNIEKNKEIGQIAYLAYFGSKMNDRKPNTFSEWYNVFCECIGTNPVKSYKPNKLMPNNRIQKLFGYLN